MRYDTVYLFTYRDSMNKKKHMAIYAEDKDKARDQYRANKEPTDRLETMQEMTVEAYRAWKHEL